MLVIKNSHLKVIIRLKINRSIIFGLVCIVERLICISISI